MSKVRLCKVEEDVEGEDSEGDPNLRHTHVVSEKPEVVLVSEKLEVCKVEGGSRV